MVMKRRPSLKVVFFEYLAAMAAALVLSFTVPFIFDLVFVNMGFYTYANTSEISAKSAVPIISSAKKFESRLVPVSASYVYLNYNFTVIQSNMENTELKNAVNYAKGKYNPSSLDDCYLIIKRKDGICILHYYIRSRYKDQRLNGILPSPDKITEVIIVLNGLFSVFAVTTLFARRLKKQLLPLLEATQKIKEQDLDFEIRSSGIQEFNHILLFISDMKSELKCSLEQQWCMEQTKKEQTSALAHDIKTPLTIIRGNAELLRDSKLTDEQQEYTRYVLNNADRMEQYLKMLIHLTQAEAGYPADLQKIDTKQFVKELEAQTNGLVSAKQLEVNLSQRNLPQEFTADAGLLGRAIMNVVSNAADYSPEHGRIDISVESARNRILFCITDSGKGFSPADLKQATSQFYMGDKSRGLKTHFGIGLYITETIIKLHKGSLNIANSTVTGGGQVTIEIPI